MSLSEAELRQAAQARIDGCNPRRLALADKKAAEGLTDEEAAEFDELQRIAFEAIEYLHPRPTEWIDDISKRIEALRSRLEGKLTEGGPDAP